MEAIAFSQRGYSRDQVLMGKNFQKKERKSCLDKEKGISGKKGETTRYLAGVLWMFNSHSLLHSGSLCKQSRAGEGERSQETGGFPGSPVNLAAHHLQM